MNCPEPGCDYDAGTVCAFHTCPGKSNTNSRASLPCAAGLAVPLSGKPQTFNKPIHAAPVAGEAQ